MKIRVISDLHSELNMTYEPTDFVDIMGKKEPADVTLIAGDMDADIDEATNFLETYFKDERVVFIGGNHILYNRRGKTIQQLLSDYQCKFNSQWLFLENNYTWLSKDVAVIGCIGWTDFLYGHKTKSQYVREIEREKRYREKHQFVDTGKLFGKGTEFDRGIQPVIHCGLELPEDPAAYYDELQMGDKASYRGRRMKEAVRCMNDYNYGKIRRQDSSIDILRPLDTYNMHQESLKYIKKAYKEITNQKPDATIILMTHHPFSTKCVSGRFKDDPLTSAFVSDHERWLKQFSQIKYVVCGHVHSRKFGKVAGNKQLICNPCGYLHYYEHIQDVPFNINKFIEV